MTSPTQSAGPLDGAPPYDLSGCDLSRVNLGGKDLTNAKLTGAKLLGAVFNGVTGMDGADLTDAVIGNGTDFTGCDLTRVNFGPKPSFGSNPLYLTKFVAARVPFRLLNFTWGYLDLTDATLVDLPRVLKGLTINRCVLNLSFAGRDLTGSRFNGAVLDGVDFSGATLINAAFSMRDGMGCVMTDARFAGADLSNVNISNCVLTECDFSRAKVSKTTVSSSRVVGCRFDETDWTDSTLSTIVRDPQRLTSFRGASLKGMPLLLSMSTLNPDLSCLDLTGAKIVDFAKSIGSLKGYPWNFDHAVVTGLDCTGIQLPNSTMIGASLAGMNFSKADLSNADFRGVQSHCELFSVTAPAEEYSALLDALRNANADKVAGNFQKRGISLGRASVKKTPRGGWTVTGDATRSVFEVVQKNSGANAGLVAADVTPNLFDGATLTGAKFGRDGSQPALMRGARFTNAKLNGADFSYADVSQINPDDKTTATQFDGAIMNNANLGHAVLNGATLTRAELHEANLVGASLKGSDLTGAQLGALTEVFHIVATGTAGDEFQRFLNALNAKDVATVTTVFGNHGRKLTPGATTVAIALADRSWTVTDSTAQTTYRVLNCTTSDNTTSLNVYAGAGAAALTGAYMPNAILGYANLYGVSATFLQLYGDKASLNGAILDGCKLTNANLSGTSLVSARLYGFDLSKANLIGTRFRGADLRSVTLSYANLQGTDFTDTTMNGADLTNAAVAVPLAPGLAGTYLFTMSGTGYQSVLAELQSAAAPGIPVTLTSDDTTIAGTTRDLNGGDIASVRKLFANQGITLPPAATIRQLRDPDAWQITGGCEYTLWHGFNDDGDDGLIAGPSLPNLKAAVAAKAAVAGTLRWQATVSQVGLPATMWRILNDNENPDNLQLGYDTMLVVKGDNNSLVFYGTTLRIQQLTGPDKTEIFPIPMVATVLGETDPNSDGSKSRLGPDSMCPNGFTLKQNQTNRLRWEQMLRAMEPPAPPTCVPSPYADCPGVSQAILEAEEARNHAAGSGLGSTP